jgi:FHA domain
LARYRLRFLLQEFDLPRGMTVIGRGVDCNLTIEDTLVSRQHARIGIDEDGGVVEDLGSRNGVRVNGVAVEGPTRLSDGDRIRIGRQDFVFCCVDPAIKPRVYTTGVLRLCTNCRQPYSRELLACPNCEATDQADEETTLSGTFGPGDRETWSVQLLVEALERAVTFGRLRDAERIVRQATAMLEDALVRGETIDSKVLASLSVQAVATSLVISDPTWGLWVLDVHRRTGNVPPLEVVECLGEVVDRHSNAFRAPLRELLEQLNTRALSVRDASAVSFSRLEKMHQKLDERAAESADHSGEWREPTL